MTASHNIFVVRCVSGSLRIILDVGFIAEFKLQFLACTLT
jgi:hypothetical protein